jgi:hypothetical protein
MTIYVLFFPAVPEFLKVLAAAWGIVYGETRLNVSHVIFTGGFDLCGVEVGFIDRCGQGLRRGRGMENVGKGLERRDGNGKVGKSFTRI